MVVILHNVGTVRVVFAHIFRKFHYKSTAALLSAIIMADYYYYYYHHHHHHHLLANSRVHHISHLS